jgi:putative spermidine/putrescine transport system substrate-binding protein
MGMSYTPFMAFRKKALGEFPASTHAFVLDGGTVSNTHFLAIPFNAPNKAGAAALIDLILSPELQASKMDPKGWGDLPVIDMSRLSPEEKALFSDLLTEEESAFLEDIARKRIPELPAAQIPVIEDLWLKSVPPQ